MVTVYTLAVFAHGFRRGRTYKGRGKHNRGAYSAIEPTSYGYQGWTADQSAERSRLPGSGTFVFNGGLRAVVAARRYLRDSRTYQVQIRTNQDRKVLVYNRQHDGRITCYNARD